MSLQIDSCIVCDFVRPELNGKLIVVGFFGVCPNVDVNLQRLDQPTALTFLFTGGPGEGEHVLAFEVADEPGHRVVASSAPDLRFRASPKGPTLLATTLLLVFGHPGTFVIRCNVDQVERFSASFRVSQAPVPIV